MKRAIQYSLLMLLLALVLTAALEGLLRLTGVLNTYYEKNFNEYKSYYQNDSIAGHLWVREANKEITLTQNEFSYGRKTNQLGLSERRDVDSSKILALALGDSFTEGMGTPEDSTWPRLLEHLLAKDCAIQTYNAGIAGSDIFFMKKLYEKKLQALNPDLLLLCLNYSDIFEYLFQGGKERFHKDGNTYFPAGPDWEIYYEKSHVVRLWVHLIMNYDFTLNSKKEIKKMLPTIFEEMANEIKWLHNNSKDMVLIIHPYPYFKEKNVPFHQDFPDLIEYLPKDLKVINLYPHFDAYFDEQPASLYYWPKDGHFNADGYLLMSRFLYREMKTLDICPEKAPL